MKIYYNQKTFFLHISVKLEYGRYLQNVTKISRKKTQIFYSKIRSFMVGTKMKIEIFGNFVKNRRNFTNFGDFSIFKKHHTVRPEPAAVLALSNFIETF